MSIYCIGDVHGCYDELQELLKLVSFDPKKDELIFTGDILGRGPKPLQVIQFIRQLGNKAHCVLGNHDLNFLAICRKLNKAKKRDQLEQLLKSEKLDEIINWFFSLPLMYSHPTENLCVVHAGIAPQWSINDAQKYAKEVEHLLRDHQTQDFFLMHMYSNEPPKWDDSLTGIPRWRFITNVFTRIRFCDKNYNLDFLNKSSPEEAKKDNLYPWYEMRPNVKFDEDEKFTLVFGHWASLGGKCTHPNARALDTGCIWGNKLTMWCYDTKKFYSVKSKIKI